MYAMLFLRMTVSIVIFIGMLMYFFIFSGIPIAEFKGYWGGIIVGLLIFLVIIYAVSKNEEYIK
jgi:hypothetical protein